jgi:hypothetical protein
MNTVPTTEQLAEYKAIADKAHHVVMAVLMEGARQHGHGIRTPRNVSNDKAHAIAHLKKPRHSTDPSTGLPDDWHALARTALAIHYDAPNPAIQALLDEPNPLYPTDTPFTEYK